MQSIFNPHAHFSLLKELSNNFNEETKEDRLSLKQRDAHNAINAE